MERYNYLIIGGGIAGVTAAETIRERDPAGRIGILSGEPHILYSRVLLPSYLKKGIRREQIFLRTREDFARRRIDLHIGARVSVIDVKRREAAVEDGDKFGYEKLLICSGGRTNQWPVEWGGEYAYRLQTLDDADRLLGALPSIKRPLVIGSSFIALEFIEIFLLNGIIPRVMSQDEHFFGRMLDAQGGALLRDNFESRGVKIFFDEEIAGVEKRREGVAVFADHSGELSAGALAVGIGIERNIRFLEGSGIEIGKKGGVRTDEFLETNIPNVFAAGDIAEYYDVVTGGQRLVGNWTNAVLQGKRAGLNMTGRPDKSGRASLASLRGRSGPKAGRREPFVNVPSYAITNLGFQITALGECDNGLEAISRIDAEGRRYARFFIRNGVLAGAFLINSFKDKPHLAELIGKRVNLEQYRGRLTDPAFDIRSIAAIK